jgi:hypothetical protein
LYIGYQQIFEKYYYRFLFCRLPIADCRLPIADCRLPIADYTSD